MYINEKFKGTKIGIALLSFALITSVYTLYSHARNIDKENAVSGKTVAGAIKRLGYTASEFKDKTGNPHFVFKGNVEGAKSVAVFMDDCGASGCEDVLLYANFGAVNKLSPETINEWNHISSMLRSRLARSNGFNNKDGEIGLSMPISLFSDKDQDKFATLMGLFLVEVKMFSATISNL